MRFRFCGDLDCPDWVLAEIATLSRLSSVRMKILVNQIIGYCIERSFNYDKVLKLASDNSDGINDIKGAIAAVHFIITNAGKHDIDEQSLVQEIQQLGLPKENSDTLGKQYREYQEFLRTSFLEDSYRFTKFVSIDWRVDNIFAISTPSTTTNNDEIELLSPDTTGLTVQLRIKYDTRPEDGKLTENEMVESSKSNRMKDVAFEMSSDQLDILIHDLSNATQFLESLQG